MEVSKYLRDVSRSIAGKEQLLLAAFARSYEVIPRELANNAGFDATDILNKLRQKHAQSGKWFGVDIVKEDLTGNMGACVWEPSLVKINAVTSAAEAACLVLSVDQTVKNPKSSAGPGGDQQPSMGRRPF